MNGGAHRIPQGFVLLILLALLLVGCGGPGGAAGGEIEETAGTTEATAVAFDPVEDLRGGGYVIFFRHAETDMTQTDAEAADPEDCSVQRNLSESGREQAQEIGAAIEQLEVPIDEVLASPYCRTRQTAELAFGRVQTSRDLLSSDYLPEGSTETPEEALRELLATPPPDGANTVLVGHEVALRTATGQSAREGGAVVFEPLEDGEFRFVDGLAPEAWAEIAGGDTT